MAFALAPHAGCDLVLAANRDEDLDRPTMAWHTWLTAAGTPVRAGRDLREGGTWIATSGHRVALLTNVRDAKAHKAPKAHGPAPRSRGALPLHWLDTVATHPNAHAAVAHLLAQGLREPMAYGGFNLVLGDVAQGVWVWLNNRPEVLQAGLPPELRAQLQHPHPELLRIDLPPGLYGLSNAGLDTPWPKTQTLKQALAHTVACASPSDLMAHEGDGPWAAPLWAALRDPQPAPDAALPHTGVPLVWERALSAVWVDVAPTAQFPSGYGTRSSLVLHVLHEGEGESRRWRFQAQERTWRPTPQAPVRDEWWVTRAPRQAA